MVALSELSDAQRDQALQRYAALRPHLEDGFRSLARRARPGCLSARRSAGWRAIAPAGWRGWRADRAPTAARRRTPAELSA